MIPHPRRWLTHPGNPAFTWLWWSQTVSGFGSQVTLIAIPLLAAISLRATAFEMGLLAAVETVPYLAFSLPAGWLADRVDRRGLLVVSNLLRAAFLLAIPIGALLGWLSLPLLYGVAFAVGTVSVVFDVAYQSYVPDLLEADELLGGNQRIELSESAARTLGPGLGGALVAMVGGALAIVADAISYVLATLALLGAGRPKSRIAAGISDPPLGGGASPEETKPRSLDTVWDYFAVLEERIANLEQRLADQEERRSSRRGGAFAGLGIVLRDRVLRDMAASTATFNLASSAILAVLVLYAVRDVGMDAATVGLFIGGGNVGFVLGALAVGALTARWGVGRTLVLSGLLGALATVILPLATGALAVGVLLAGRFVGAFAIPLFNVNARALRQSRAPREALGRVNAVFRLLDWGTLPVGALLGGWIGDALGLRATLVMGGLLGVASAAWLVWSPLRHIRQLRDRPEEAIADQAAVGSEGARQLLPGATIAARATPWALAALARVPTIRWAWLAIGGVALQVTLMLPEVSAWLGDAAPAGYVASSIAVLACVLRNVRIPGLALVALGGIANVVVIAANGGYMPVSPEAARAAGHPPVTGFTHTVERVEAVFQPLTDILVVPAPLPMANVYSIGDVLIAVGLLVTIIWMLARSRPPTPRSRVERHGGPGLSPHAAELAAGSGMQQTGVPPASVPTIHWRPASRPPSVSGAAKVAAGANRPEQTRREAGTQSQGASVSEGSPVAGSAASW